MEPIATLPVRAKATIRFCRAEDLRPLEWFGHFTAHREIIEDTWARKERGETEMLVLEVQRFPAGQVWIDFGRRARERVAVIWALRVIEPLQSLGMGRALVRAAERLITERGYEVAELAVEESNAGARRLYERLGYQYAGEERETTRYRLPTGEEVEHFSEHWLLRKPVAPAEAVRSHG